MENVESVKIENQKSVEVSAEKKIAKVKKSTDDINLSSVKVDLKKGAKGLFTKEKVSSKREIYKSLETMNQEEKKKKRNSLRRELNRFVNSILGKDRSEIERTENIKGFLKFYKANWKIVDFKIENFSQNQDAGTLKDYINLLKFVQSVLA